MSLVSFIQLEHMTPKLRAANANGYFLCDYCDNKTKLREGKMIVSTDKLVCNKCLE
jgi:hypothetical protein